ncbi:hypothetical protein FJZ26_01590 [Candidatus Parvarchaeota archaeon]|nr:hypothetical protein [Candidatus Parvarchaeota archaeon]
MPEIKKVVLDTNVLMLPYQFRIDVAGEVGRLVDGKYVFVTTSKALAELEKLKETKKVSSRAARLAISYAGHLKNKGLLEIIESSMKVDDWIVDYARKSAGCIVCTNDMLLKARLKGCGVRLLGLRSKDHLDFV